MSDADDVKKVPLRIRLPFATEAEFIERYGVNVARGGFFVASKATRAVGTLLSFEVVLADGARLMRGEGVVQRVTPEGTAERAGMMVRFTRVDARTKELVDRIQALREGEPAVAAPPPAPPSAPEPPAAATPRVLKPAATALAEDVVLGIDFGTTTCRAAVVVEGAVQLVSVPSERGLSIPSVVAWDAARATFLVGSAARRHAVDFPDQTAIGFKRLLGRRVRSRPVKELAQRFAVHVVPDPEGDAGIELGGRVFAVPELVALLLRELKAAAQDALGRELSRAVLCVPAWYSDYQRAALREAGRLAGLDVLRLLNEPTAVALAFGHGRGLARKRVLVYDLGGGTFDASVVEITGDDLEVVSTGGDAFLGGLDFDQRLALGLVGALPPGPQARVRESRIAQERIREASERAKISLSEGTSAPVHVPFATTDDAGQPMDLRSDVQRAFLDEHTRDLVERTLGVTRTVLEAARLSPQALDEVLVVGGQSRSPAVRAALEQLVGKPARTDVDAQGAVAMGAALLGQALVLEERGKRGGRLAEVLSAPIGYAVRGGGLRRVFERNTRLPAEKSVQVPLADGAATRLLIFQGAAPRAEDNEYLGSLSLGAERSGAAEVRFRVSVDGLLELVATGAGGRPLQARFSTLDTTEDEQIKAFAEAPLPSDEPGGANEKGLLSGFKRWFGR